MESTSSACKLSTVDLPNTHCVQCGRKGDLTYYKCANEKHGYMGGYAGCKDCWRQCHVSTIKTPCHLSDVKLENTTCVQCNKSGDLTYKKCSNSTHGYMGGYAGCKDCWKQCYDDKELHSETASPCNLQEVHLPNSRCVQCGKSGDLTYKKCTNDKHGYMGGYAGCTDCWRQCFNRKVTKPCNLSLVHLENTTCVQCGKSGNLTYKKCNDTTHGYMGGYAGCVDCYKQCHHEEELEQTANACQLSTVLLNNTSCVQCGRSGNLTYHKCANEKHGYMGGYAGCADCWKQCFNRKVKKPCALSYVFLPNTSCVLCKKAGDLTYRKCNDGSHGYMGGYAGCTDCYKQCYHEEFVA